MESLDDRSIDVLENNTERDAQQQQRQFNAVGQQALSVSLSDGGRKTIGNAIYKSIKTVLLTKKFNLLIPFGPLAILVQKQTGQDGWVFILGLLGIMPLAERLSYTTEQLAFHSGPTVGGLLNATFGNATELIISIYALRTGQIRVFKLSLLGSILSNLLFVLGCAFFFGGIVRKKQVFNKGMAVVSSGLLLMMVMGLLFPAFLHDTHTEVQFGMSELNLSRSSSCIMLAAYVVYIIFQLKNLNDLEESQNRENSEDDEEEEAPEITKWESVIWLAITAAAISFLSEYLVDAIEGASLAWGVPVAFITVILLPIGGNTAAVTTSVMFAMKNKLDVSLAVSIGSSTQVSMFLIPFCVVMGWIFGRPVDLNFQLFETATLFMTVLFVAFMLQEGTSNYFKGLMLIFCYLIVSASYFVHKDPLSCQLQDEVVVVQEEQKVYIADAN